MSASKRIRSASTLRGLVLVLALATLLVPVAAWADTLILDSMTMTFIATLQGFSLREDLIASGPNYSVVASAIKSGTLPSCISCPPGTLFTTRSEVPGNTLAVVTYQGVTYSGGSGDFVSWQAGGPPILLPPIAPSFSASVPFAIQIHQLLSPCLTGSGQDPCTPITVVDAFGNGVATFSFAPDIINLQTWRLESGVYEIEPIPEPSTWLLVPTAVGLAWLARKKRRATYGGEC